VGHAQPRRPPRVALLAPAAADGGRRCEGRSEGEPNGFGWGGDEDIKAAVAYLKTRADVDPSKIGGIGLSVGGELMLEAAAETKDLAAVVSEGAGARTRAEEVDTEGLRTLDRVLTHISYAVRDATVAIASGRKPPQHLKRLVGRIAPRPLLLIAAPNTANGEKLNRI
jgi:poly(3-hydroxybutyrate) depolymerase